MPSKIVPCPIRACGLSEPSIAMVSLLRRWLARQVSRATTLLKRRPAGPGTLVTIDWSLFHLLNTGVATRDWLEDPVTTFARLAVPLYAVATVALWFVSRPPGVSRWRLASVSALVAAGIALVANQA